MKYEINKIYNMDCLDAMREIPNNYFELAIVDPPYGININESMGRRKGQKHSGHKKAYWDNSTPDKKYFDELLRISKNQIVWGGNYFIDFLKSTPCFLMWDKGFSEDVSFAQFELAWTSFKSSCKKFDKSSFQSNRLHPTQKPIALYKWLLKNYAQEGDKILDTHLGSASSIIACIDMGFDFMGFELDEDYFKASAKRINSHLAQADITRDIKFNGLKL